MNQINTTMNTVVMLFNNTQDVIGYWPTVTISVLSFLGTMTILSTMYSVFRGARRVSNRKQNSGSSGRKRKDEIIHKLQTTILKDHATVEGLTLLVGALSKKVEGFDGRVAEVEEYMDNELTNELKELGDGVNKINEGIKSLDGDVEHVVKDIETMKQQTTERFQKVQRNFALLTSKLGNFTEAEYKDFVEIVRSDLKALQGAIFVPVDSEEDSEYTE